MMVKQGRGWHGWGQSVGIWEQAGGARGEVIVFLLEQRGLLRDDVLAPSGELTIELSSGCEASVALGVAGGVRTTFGNPDLLLMEMLLSVGL